MNKDWRGMAEGTELRELEGRAGRASQRTCQVQPGVEGDVGCLESLCSAKVMATISYYRFKRSCPRVRGLCGEHAREAQKMRPSWCVLI